MARNIISELNAKKNSSSGTGPINIFSGIETGKDAYYARLEKQRQRQALLEQQKAYEEEAARQAQRAESFDTPFRYYRKGKEQAKETGKAIAGSLAATLSDVAYFLTMKERLIDKEKAEAKYGKYNPSVTVFGNEYLAPSQKFVKSKESAQEGKYGSAAGWALEGALDYSQLVPVGAFASRGLGLFGKAGSAASKAGWLNKAPFVNRVVSFLDEVAPVAGETTTEALKRSMSNVFKSSTKTGLTFGPWGAGYGAAEGLQEEAPASEVVKLAAESALYTVIFGQIMGLPGPSIRAGREIFRAEKNAILKKTIDEFEQASGRKLTAPEKEAIEAIGQRAANDVEARIRSQEALNQKQAEVPIKTNEIPVGETVVARYTDRAGEPVEVKGTAEKVSTSAPKIQTGTTLKTEGVVEKPVQQYLYIRGDDGNIKRVNLASSGLELYKMEQTAAKPAPKVAPKETQAAPKTEKPKTETPKITAKTSQKQENLPPMPLRDPERIPVNEKTVKVREISADNDSQFKYGVSWKDASGDVQVSSKSWRNKEQAEAFAKRLVDYAVAKKKASKLPPTPSKTKTTTKTTPVKRKDLKLVPKKPEPTTVKGPTEKKRAVTGKKEIEEIQPAFGVRPGKTKSKAYRRLNRYLRENGIEGGLGYEKLPNKVTRSRSLKVAVGDQREAYQIAFGYKNKPGVLNADVNTVLRYLNENKGDSEMAALLFANRTRQLTRHAQELQSANIKGESHVHRFLREALAARMQQAEDVSLKNLRSILKRGKASREKILDEAVSVEVAQLEEIAKKRKNDVSRALNVIDSIIC